MRHLLIGLFMLARGARRNVAGPHANQKLPGGAAAHEPAPGQTAREAKAPPGQDQTKQDQEQRGEKGKDRERGQEHKK